MKKILGAMLILVLFAAMVYGNSDSTRAGHDDSKDKDSSSVNAKTHEDGDDEDSPDGRWSHHQGHKDKHKKSHGRHEHGECEHDDDDDGTGNPANPVVAGVTPLEVKAGDQIQINGTGFGSSQGPGSVSINSAVTTSIVSWTDTMILAVVPANATTGPVVVTQANVASNPGRIVVLWAKEYPENVAISAAAGGQQAVYPPVSDGSGGAIIAWWDYRSGSPGIYVQRVNSAGVVQWAADGVAITVAANDSYQYHLATDGADGAIITWPDDLTGTVRAQRVNSAGVVQWAAGGVVIATVVNDGGTLYQYLQIVADGSGGAFIAWDENRNGIPGIRAQRVNSAGTTQWAADGVAVAMPGDLSIYYSMSSDASGGVIIAWQDLRNGADFDIYAQRINSAGAMLWAANGVPVSTAAGHQFVPQITTDGAGGAIISWQDQRNGTSFDIYAQRVSSAGVTQWAVDGITLALATPPNFLRYPQIVSDNSGGAIIAWLDNRNYSTGNVGIYAQRVNSAGATQWVINGVVLTTFVNLSGSTPGYQLISDNAGGGIIVWREMRNGIYNDFAQRVDVNGTMQWTPNGVTISAPSNYYPYPQCVSDGSGGAIVFWTDSRNGGLYAQGISASGRQ